MLHADPKLVHLGKVVQNNLNRIIKIAGLSPKRNVSTLLNGTKTFISNIRTMKLITLRTCHLPLEGRT